MKNSLLHKRLTKLEQVYKERTKEVGVLLIIDDVGQDDGEMLSYREQLEGETLRDYKKYLDSIGIDSLVLPLP